MVTLADLRRDASGTAVESLQFRHFMWRYQKPPYDEWVAHVEEAISQQCREMVRHKHHINGHSEDALTAQVLQGLRMLALDARMEVVGGNCDVTVSYADEYLWIGEAKLANSVTWVYEGYNQLLTRYATGLPAQNAGGMLIYCCDKPSNVFMAQWRAALEEQLGSASLSDHDAMRPAFWSAEDVPATGLSMRVFHLPFPLFQEPLEGKRKLSGEALKASRQARKDALRSEKKRSQG